MISCFALPIAFLLPPVVRQLLSRMTGWGPPSLPTKLQHPLPFGFDVKLNNKITRQVECLHFTRSSDEDSLEKVRVAWRRSSVVGYGSTDVHKVNTAHLLQLPKCGLHPIFPLRNTFNAGVQGVGNPATRPHSTIFNFNSNSNNSTTFPACLGR